MQLELNGKVALVTGASKAIDAAIAAELGRKGMHPCQIVRDSAALRQVANTIKRTANINVKVLSADLIDSTMPKRIFACALSQFGRLDLPVNNADATKQADFFTLIDDD